VTENRLVLMAPLSGVMMPLEQVPDPVFAQKLVGDGVSIDPTSQDLLAPCDGRVIQIHACGHALTLQTEQGLEIMMHIGLDTVHLKGKGFAPKVKAGDQVKTGQLLITFDADAVARQARSLLTQILVTTPERVGSWKRNTGLFEAGRQPLLELVLQGAGATADSAGEGRLLTSEAVVVPNPTGLHARPAAVLVQLARRFKADIRLRKGEGAANARSVVSIMALDVRHGDKILLTAQGVDAEQALALIVPELKNGLGETGSAPVQEATGGKSAQVAAPPVRPRSEDPHVLVGVSASPGLAVGSIYRLRHQEIAVVEDGDSPEAERVRLREALEQAKLQLTSLHDRLAMTADAGKAAIFAAHQELLEDPDVLELAESAMAKGKSAAFAWSKAFAVQADRLAAMKNELLAARANDLRDVGRRVLRLITGTTEEKRSFPAETILVAEDLTPSDTANLDRAKVLGFCTVAGGSTSHVAILARSLGIPAIAGIEPRVLETADQTPAVLDGTRGVLRLHPSNEEMTRVKKQQAELAAQREVEIRSAAEPAITTDGHRVAVVANIGGQADSEQSVKLGGEGVGLLRSEFLFIDRNSPPNEDEQTQTYQNMARALGTERTLVIRTLDVGGDKPLPYLPIPREDNPFLGERGIRVSLDRPEIFRTQLRAILRASVGYRIHVMFPMVASLAEWRAARGQLEVEARALGIPIIPAGIMVEVPAAALLAEHFADEADFFSLGTNDLTQYTLAMDRGHPKLAPHVDGLHPSVLKLIKTTIDGARPRKRSVSVCGGLAGDSRAVPVLIGLGIDKLSVSVPSIPAVKAQIRRLSLRDCQSLAQKALAAGDAAQVRSLVDDALKA